MITYKKYVKNHTKKVVILNLCKSTFFNKLFQAFYSSEILVMLFQTCLFEPQLSIEKHDSFLNTS